MRIEMDQSGKIENTNRNTIIGFSNGISKSIIISGNDKKKLQELFREAGRHRVFVYKTFAILIFILIKDYLNKLDEIIIDEEYPGKFNLIRSYLFSEIEKIDPDFPKENVVCARIGKKSKAHYVAYGTAIGKRKADKVVKFKDILKFIVK
ncbi:MAG: hypothetical protein Q8N69_01575 [bacterium]|nr:hypothetical protein [bacterium]